ncbi:exodeoxyribonuclease V subunit beta [Shewanella sp. NIFS-20-20]|uniref:exodeoxyribonuclease V subunit beta n=1 Tax=Shewanella sp. NIFS-20-20 TaxID=2853806 RepID=UPI001C4840EC|nr:exodeoxyribonuclease V subunit beta [Shewanella sp. NIFS-20-20]MBV7315079.1 exodeoxyribonuclease V subunit beta [Shewanella sp. NIFS-20-20]
MTATALDALTLPLLDRRLIEASAGTGKTYTISGLYLRLLLGDDAREPLSCEQILVVTFTNAATAELRDRIRNRIKACYQRFIGLDVADDFINRLYDSTPASARNMALRRLDLALKSLDEAAIYTIHGFCQRILSDMAFESALLFESEFTLDDSQYLQHSVRDFWRHACYQLPEVLAAAVFDNFNQPTDLLKQIRPLLGASQAKVNRQVESFSHLSERLLQQVARLKLEWPRSRDSLEELLHQLPLNGTSYGKQADKFPKLAAMMAQMDNWCQFHHGLPAPKLLDQLSLSQLKLKKGGVIPTAAQAPLLAQIEELNITIRGLIPAFLLDARQQVNARTAQLKQERNLLSPDDLLVTLATVIGGLHSQVSPQNDTSTALSAADVADIDVNTHAQLAISKQLTQSIAKRFPVALIDEFQDTDPLQFAIFSGIYPAVNQAPTANTLLMIGDPKQAIYAFRGADIFTYIAARKQTEHHYHLDTNYRSATHMVDAVNQVFANSQDPFISEAISFDDVKAADQGKKTIIEPNSSAALQLRLLAEDPQKGLNKTNARKHLAADASNEIARLLNLAKNNQALFASGKSEPQPIRAKDIAVLVRDRNEANVMRDALTQRGIGAVFLSRDSVLETDEARQMVLILRALVDPKDERAIRAALACRLIGFSASQIHQFNQSEQMRAQILEQFFRLHQLWLRRGIMPALLNLADSLNLLARLQQDADADRQLTDFRHLAELLQQKSAELDGQTALLNWFEQEREFNQGAEEQQLRLESEQNLVQIVTIHKSKGLEYPVCFIPFVSLARDQTRRPTPMLYHQQEQLIWDIDGSDDGWEQTKIESLAEDLRLLYVALTRPVYRCYLYIANHCRISKKGDITSFLKDTAIGYLLGIIGKDTAAADIEAAVKHLVVNSNAAVMSSNSVDVLATAQTFVADSHQQAQLSAKEPIARNHTPWRVGSYSGLVKHLAYEKVQPGVDDEGGSDAVIMAPEPELNQEQSLSRFTFERGANAGSFMHLVLEMVDFTQAQQSLAECLPKAMAQYQIDEQWYPELLNWYQAILASPLTSHGSDFCLAQLSAEKKLVEMEFYLPTTSLDDRALSSLLTRYGYSGDLRFDGFQGMLKGFIDLTFEYQGRYYIADYKSNHLGSDFNDYQQIPMANAIRSHRYDLQYLIYTLALHRYLSLRLSNYHYDHHFGGCYYLFLRGMSPQHPERGVFFDKPPLALIEALDQLLQTPPRDANTPMEPAL